MLMMIRDESDSDRREKRQNKFRSCGCDLLNVFYYVLAQALTLTLGGSWASSSPRFHVPKKEEGGKR